MSLAKKCDRCGKLYEHYPSNGDRQYNSVKRLIRSVDSCRYSAENTKDLCPDCMMKLNTFLEGGKFSDESI